MKHLVPLAILLLVAGCASIDVPFASEGLNAASPAPDATAAPTMVASMPPVSSRTASPLIPAALTLALNGQPVALAGTLTVTRNDSEAQINLTSFGPKDHFKAGDRLLVVEVHPGWQSNASASALLYQMAGDRLAAPEWESDRESQIVVQQSSDRVEGQLVSTGSPSVRITFAAPIGAPEPSPACIPSPADLGAASLGGRLFDAQGMAIASGTVEVISSDTSVPFDATAHLQDGVYAVGDVPIYEPLRLIAHASGYASVERDVTLKQDLQVPGDPSHCGWQGPSLTNWIDFGGHEALDPSGEAFGLIAGRNVPSPLSPPDASPTATPKPQ